MVGQKRQPIGTGDIYPDSTPRDSAPGFADSPLYVQIVRVELAAAQSLKRYYAVGSFIWAIDASSITAKCQIRFGDQHNSLVPFSKGQVIQGIDFDELYVTNDAQSGEWIDFMIVRGRRTIDAINPAESASEVSLIDPTILTGSGAQTIATATTDTIAANASRKEIEIQADPGNTGNLHLRDDAANAIGVLQPGQSWSKNVTDEIQVRNDSGANQNYYYSETE